MTEALGVLGCILVPALLTVFVVLIVVRTVRLVRPRKDLARFETVAHELGFATWKGRGLPIWHGRVDGRAAAMRLQIVSKCSYYLEGVPHGSYDLALALIVAVDIPPLGGDCYTRKNRPRGLLAFDELFHCQPVHAAQLSEDQKRTLVELVRDFEARVLVERSDRAMLPRRGLDGAAVGLEAHLLVNNLGGPEVRQGFARLIGAAVALEQG